MKADNPHNAPVWELRFILSKDNRDRYEVLGTYPIAGMAWGMRQKFHKKAPKKYPISKLWVEKVHNVVQPGVQLIIKFDK
jgi:hypothetical protein